MSYGGLTQTATYTYSASTTSAKITGISPTSYNPTLKGVMTITGQDFGNDQNAVEIHLSNSTGKMYQMRIV